MGVKEGVDPKNLAEAGWGVIFAHNVDPAIRSALDPLIQHRREQAGDYYQIYEGSHAYLPGESKSKFLARQGAGPGPADPEKVPYYLLIVGSPQAIDYRFQLALDVQYAVGRIHFDTPQEYATYAASVVKAEREPLKVERQIAFFSAANPDDWTTQLSTKELIEPLHWKLSQRYEDWQVNSLLREQATKAQLSRLLGGDQTPALLMAAGHGMVFPPDSPRQLCHQGALLCQDWPGPAWQGAIPHDFYFAGDDLAVDAQLWGLIALFYASYGAGTHLTDTFAKQAFKVQSDIAPYPFIAALPNKMLSHPKGGALAFIGLSGHAWDYSFSWPTITIPQMAVFESVLERLLDRHPVGSAFEYFNERYSELSIILSNELEEIDFGKQADPYSVGNMWTATTNAGNLVIVGDPAVRLPVAGKGETPMPRPIFQAIPMVTEKIQTMVRQVTE